MNRQLAAIFSLVLVWALPAMAADDADKTLAPADYVAKGLPPIDRPWMAQDYENALAALHALKPEQLPRTSSPRSAPVIAHMTDPDNLKLFVDKSTPVAARIPLSLRELAAVTGIGVLYVNGYAADHSLAEDNLRLSGFALRIAVAQTGMLDDFVASLDKEDPRYQQYMGGIAQVHQAVTLMVHSAIGILADTKMNTAPVRANFARVMAEIYPALVPVLPPKERTADDQAIGQMAQNDPVPEVRTALAPLAADATH